MERVTIDIAANIFGENFIGPKQLELFFKKINKEFNLNNVPEIPFDLAQIKKYATDYLLILGVAESVDHFKLNIDNLRNIYGTNPDESEPCFYNQDWYLNQPFTYKTLENKWYLVKKHVIEETRANGVDDILRSVPAINFPDAILCVYTFFAYYHSTSKLLWQYDFIWCNDEDHNGDRIYVAKYKDIDGVNKNGFSIHRHLKLRNCYASINVI